MENPISTLIRQEKISEVDFAVMEHRFAPHGRDYIFIVQEGLVSEPGTYELILTHVTSVKYETRVRDDVWGISWSDEFTSYAAWEAASEPEGYVLGTNWSLAYPGISVPTSSAEAEDWSRRLNKLMYPVSIETDRFKITLIFHTVIMRRISSDRSLLEQVLIPLPPVSP